MVPSLPLLSRESPVPVKENLIEKKKYLVVRLKFIFLYTFFHVAMVLCRKPDWKICLALKLWRYLYIFLLIFSLFSPPIIFVEKHGCIHQFWMWRRRDNCQLLNQDSVFHVFFSDVREKHGCEITKRTPYELYPSLHNSETLCS